MAERRADPKNRYRDRISGETEEAFGINNVPGLNRPMMAGPKDYVIREDELGNKTYYNPTTKREYTVSVAEDQRTTRGKVEDWMEAGAPLPSAEQVGETLKAIPGAMYDSAQNMLEGTATLGEVVGVAPGMQAAGAGAKVPAGALRTGGGRNTENPKYNPLFREEALTQEKFDQAKTLNEIWQDLGVIDDEVDSVAAAANKLGLDPEEFRAQLFRFDGDDPQQLFEQWAKARLDSPTFKAFYNMSSDIKTPEDLSKVFGYEDEVEFYNPLRSTVENMDFGKQGLKGETIASFLEKRAPKVRKSLLRSADSGKGIFKAGQRYTQEEALNILDENFGTVSARVLGNSHYPDTQRMNFLENKEKDYGELVINQDRTVNFKANAQHYDEDTLAHARFSIRDDGAGGDMLVVEELQSDLVQKGFSTDVKGKPEVTMAQALDQIQVEGEYQNSLRDALKVYYSDSEPTNEQYAEAIATLDFAKYGEKGASAETFLQFALGNTKDPRKFLRDKLENSIRISADEVEEIIIKADQLTTMGKPPVSLPPVDSTTEFVRPLIHALMVEAKNRGIDKVVIPNSDAFIEARKGQLGGDESDIASTKKAFKQTYDDAVDKVLKELDREMGVDVNIERINLRGRPDLRLVEGFDELDNRLVEYGMELDTFERISPSDFADRARNLNSRVTRQEALATHAELTKMYMDLQDKTKSVQNKYPSRMITLGNIPKGKIRFAEGGLVDDPMETQMKFAFMNEGGMIDDGATVEPTTGNEVPPGSTKEEVADTIDAKLSVGEYVVPADVVQYFGVAYFEKLRKKAKEGLAEMESDGRIGGDPEEDELPFSDEELEAEDMEEDGAQGFAEGGLAQMAGLTNTGVETVNYVGPDGSKMPILFMNGQPIQQIPQGYQPEGQAKAQQAAFKSIRPGVTKDEGERPLNTMEAKPINEWGVEDFERYSNAQSVMDIATKLPALLGPGGAIMGGLMNKAYQMQGQQALEEIDNRLAMTDLDAQSRQRLETVKQNLSSRESEGGGLFGGDGLLGGLTGGGGLLDKMFGGGVRTTSETPSSGSPRPSGGTPARAPTSGGSSSAGLAPKSSPRPQANPTRSSTTSQVPKNSTPAQKETYSSSGKNNSQQVSGDPRNFAEGGFVKRRNKT